MSNPDLTFIKAAASRAIREIRKAYKSGDESRGSRLADQYVQAMRSGKIRSREHTVRQLGEGSYQRSEHVISPEFGSSVRKRYLGIPQGPMNPELNKHLGEVAYPNVAGFLGERGSGAQEDRYRYWQLAHGGRGDHVAPMKPPRANPKVVLQGDAPLRAARKAAESRGDLTSELAIIHRMKRLGARRQAYINRQSRWSRDAENRPTPGMAADVAQIEKAIGKQVYDWAAPRNSIGGTIVDMDQANSPAINRTYDTLSRYHLPVHGEPAQLTPLGEGRPRAPESVVATPSPVTPTVTRQFPYGKALAVGALGGLAGYGLYRYFRSKKRAPEEAA